jgi:hypothetical protein
MRLTPAPHTEEGHVDVKLAS